MRLRGSLAKRGFGACGDRRGRMQASVRAPRCLEAIIPPPRYPSDLSDQEWAILEPLLSLVEKRGRPPKWPLRHVADAVFYLLRSGCSWRMLPKGYPPWQTVYYHFRKWRIDGRLRRAHERLHEAVREAKGRDRDPSAAVIDSQPGRQDHPGRRTRTRLRRSEASGRTEAPHPGGHGRAGVGREGPRRRPTRSGRREKIARGR
jgi:transposase